ncbi:MAG TPA: isocitrate lyase/phosphoenolpyruvate mutase family protein [Phycisphaerales bacterium]|nr:isocitrate lyase/phosphoenolpyruvate mutase family protein [Phycisphaerales bacterium]
MRQQPPGQRLRALLDNPPGPEKTVMMPGAFNALCAKTIADAGFHAAYISGAATSVSAGVPDVGLLGLEHFCRCIREAYDASNLPIIADADTGFGESEMVRRTTIEYARAGAAGLHIEDQVFPKRCGHLDGKKLIPLDHAVEKIRAAAAAAKQLNNGFIICARTDARGVEGFDAAVSRAKAYLEAGADMIFPEGLTTEQEFADFAQKLRAGMPQAGSPTVREGSGSHPPARQWYLLANMTEFGKTPIIPAQKFAQMGYHCVIYPVSMLRVAMGAVTRALATLKREGSVQPLLAEMQTREQLYKTIGYTPGVEWPFPTRS